MYSAQAYASLSEQSTGYSFSLLSSEETRKTSREMLEELLTWRLRVEVPLPLPRHRYVLKRETHGYWGPAS